MSQIVLWGVCYSRCIKPQATMTVSTEYRRPGHTPSVSIKFRGPGAMAPKADPTFGPIWRQHRLVLTHVFGRFNHFYEQQSD